MYTEASAATQPPSQATFFQDPLSSQKDGSGSGAKELVLGGRYKILGGHFDGAWDVLSGIAAIDKEHGRPFR